MEPPAPPVTDEDRIGRWTDAILLRGANVRSPFVVTVIVLALLLCYVITYRLGGAGSVAPGWFGLVVLIGAARFRYVGAVVVAVAATLLAGPLMPLDVSMDSPQRVGVWVGRGLTFLLIGLVTAALVDRVQAARQRELDLAKEQRDLAVRKAAVIATVSHEFRTPLTTIVGVARTLEVHDMVSDEGLPLLQGLMDATRRLVDLVTTVGAVMEHDETLVRPEPIVMRELLDQVVDHVRVRNPRGQVAVDIDPRAELAVCDREMLGQLLRHIVENAVKFSPAGEQVEIRVVRAGSRLLVRVTDRGPGIDEDFLEHWDPFSQGDASLTRSKQGLGLGLFAASRLAEILGGSIAFRRGHQGGTLAVIEVIAPDPADVTSEGPDLHAVAG